MKNTPDPLLNVLFYKKAHPVIAAELSDLFMCILKSALLTVAWNADDWEFTVLIPSASNPLFLPQTAHVSEVV